MNARYACVASAFLLCYSPLVFSQRSAAGRFCVQKLESKATLERDSSGFAPRRASASDLANQGDELFQLGESISKDLEQSPAELKPADLERKLKRIEKLSKKLRDEIGPDPLR